RAPGSRGPSASKNVSFPRRASDPASVNRSVRSITCMPRCSVTKSTSGSRSATQKATWSSVFGFTLRGYPRGRGLSLGLGLLPVDRPLELRLLHLRPALDPQLPSLVVELVARPSPRAARARPEAATAPGGDVLLGEPRRLLG